MNGWNGLRFRAAGAAVVLAALLHADGVLVVKAKRAYPVSGEPIAPCVLVVRDGKIAQIEKELAETPEGATVLSAEVVIPGIIDAMSSVGLRPPLNEESSEVTPRILASELFDGSSPELHHARSRGITVAHIAPGTDNVIGGLCALVTTYGPPNRKLIFKDMVALETVLGTEPASGNTARGWGPPQDLFFRRPTTRMAVIQMFRESFNRARDVIGGTRESTPDLNVLVQVLKGELPLRVHAGTIIDIRALLREANRLGLTPILENGWEAHKEAKTLAARNIPVVLAPDAVGLRMWDRSGDATINNAGMLAANGVKIALTTGGLDLDPLFIGAMAVRHGLAEEAALRALTLAPAEILGIDKERGSLETGKVADLVLLSGPPLSATARVLKVIGNGDVVFPKGGR